MFLVFALALAPYFVVEVGKSIGIGSTDVFQHRNLFALCVFGKGLELVRIGQERRLKTSYQTVL